MKRKFLTTRVAQYYELLQARRSELLAEIPQASEEERVAEEDQAARAHDQFISLEIQRRVYSTVKEIDVALDRLLAGEFGVCVNCGVAIAPRRLAAIPWAAYCIRCQEYVGRDVEKLDEKAA